MTTKMPYRKNWTSRITANKMSRSLGILQIELPEKPQRRIESLKMAIVNHQFRLAARPVGMPKRSDWTYAEEPVREPGEGEFLVKILYISLDPAMRGWMNESR
jgi:hypothetical protein